MTYRAVVEKLGLVGVCLGGCGIETRSHRAGFVFLDVVHWRERRMTKRGLRNFLLLVARRDREASVDYLNAPGLWPIHLYLDARKADGWALQVGVRFPIALSGPERRLVALLPGLSRRHPAMWAWARRGELL